MLCKTFLRTLTATALTLVAFSSLAAAEEGLSRRTPAVVRSLQSRYKAPDSFTYGPPMSVPGIPGVAQAKGLADLVAIERRLYPGACITAGFYDFRTVSQYRSHAGLHLGYDIAMPPGNQVACGWGGIVTSIVVWSGMEHGITVVSPDGTHVTYGHLSPRVKVGAVLKPGDIVGVIVRDHVDVKMRDAAGNYKDFGGGQGTLANRGANAVGALYTPPTWVNMDWQAKPEPTKESLLTAWLVATNSRDMAKQELDRLEHQAYQRKIEEDQLKKRADSLQKTQKLLKLTTASPELLATTLKLSQLQVVRALDKQQLMLLDKQLRRSRDEVSSAKKAAEEKGLTYADVDSLVDEAVSSDKGLSQSVETYKKSTQTHNTELIAELQTQLSETEQTLYKLQEMEKIGGVDQNELEAVKEKRRLLQVQLRAARPEPQDWFFRESED